MGRRKSLSASVRWAVFARDGFTCRYCGARAGQDGVQLHCDHVVSVVDGGDNSMDNLITACQRCNGGKGARSIASAPDADRVARGMISRAESIRRQAESIETTLAAERRMAELALQIKRDAYERDSIELERGELHHISKLIKEFGADTVLSWYRKARWRRVPDWDAIRYVNGVARKVRIEGA